MAPMGTDQAKGRRGRPRNCGLYAAVMAYVPLTSAQIRSPRLTLQRALWFEPEGFVVVGPRVTIVESSATARTEREGD